MITRLAIPALLAAFIVSAPACADSVKGRIKSISNKASTIQIKVKGKPQVVVRFGPDTQYQGVEGIKALNPPDLIKVEYEPGQVASKISKIVFGLPAGVEIDERELLAILQGKRGPYLLGDARPAKKHAAGHIPSAISTPAKKKDKPLPGLPNDKNKLLVFYCGGPTCPFTSNAVGLAQKQGHTRVKGYQAGIPGWKRLKLPVHTSRGWLAKRLNKHHVVLDVRPAAKAAGQHLASAVSLPTPKLAAMRQGFIDKQVVAKLPGVSDKRAPIIVYADTHSTRDALLAFKELRSWGYKNVSILEGGMKAWLADGLPTTSNALASDIHFVKKLAKGAIAPEEFASLVSSKAAVFVDVRSDAEIAKHGMLAGARHIPLDDLEARVSELPAQTEIITYCENGIRAEMAYDSLKALGYTVRFLNEAITFDDQGGYQL